jgi:hypothetical protein
MNTSRFLSGRESRALMRAWLRSVAVPLVNFLFAHDFNIVAGFLKNNRQGKHIYDPTRITIIGEFVISLVMIFIKHATTIVEVATTECSVSHTARKVSIRYLLIFYFNVRCNFGANPV